MARCADVTFVSPAETRANSSVASRAAAGADDAALLVDEPAGTELVGVPAVVDAHPARAPAAQTSSSEPSARRVMIRTYLGGLQSGRSRSSASTIVYA